MNVRIVHSGLRENIRRAIPVWLGPEVPHPRANASIAIMGLNHRFPLALLTRNHSHKHDRAFVHW